MKTKLALLSPCLAFVLGTSPISAAPIIWTTHNITSDVGDISTAGTVHDARTGRLGSGNNVIVNGVTFLAVENSGNLFDSLFANDGISNRGYGNVVVDANYRTFLAYGQRSGRLGQNVLPRIEPTQLWTTVNFSGLTVGNTYQIQIWYSDNGGAIAQNQALVLGDGVTTDTPVFGTDAQLLCEVANGGAGQYGIGVFVADAATQSFNVRTRKDLTTTSSWANSDHYSNGWQIRDLGLDTSAPTPSQMTWASVPTAVTESSITMTATTASDQTGVEYQFTRYAANGTTLLFTSPWQSSPVYTDTGLSPETTYTYTVTARDKHPTPHTGDPSTPVAPATTPPLDNTLPNPSPMDWASVPTATGYSTITMTATSATDVSGVEYQFTRYAADGTTLLFTSAWQASSAFTDTGLVPNTTYTYTVRARDKSDARNTTLPSTPAAPATTALKGTATISWTAFNISAGNGTTDVSTAGTLLDARNGAITDVTVNGVTFLSVANSGNLFDSLFANDFIGTRAGTNPTDSDGSNYFTFLAYPQRSGRLTDPNPPQIAPTQLWATTEFFNLTIGNTYQIQIWASDTNTTLGDAARGGLLLGNGAAGDPVLNTDTMLLYEVQDGAVAGQYGPGGQYGIGTFVANAPNQAFNVRKYSNLHATPTAAVSDHQANGWQIRDLGIVGPVDVANSTVSASPSSVPADGNSTSTITVTVKDDIGNPVPGKVVSLTGNPGNAMIQIGNSMSNGAGIVTFTVKSNTSGTEQFTATVDSEVIPQTASVNFIPTATLVINLGAGTDIEGGTFGTNGATNLPLPALPVGSILRSIAVNTQLEATDNLNYASDLAVLLDPTPGAPGGDFSVEITNGANPFGATVPLVWPASANASPPPAVPLVNTKTAADWAAVAPIDLATTGLFLGNAYTNESFVPGQGGTWSGTITLTYDLVGGVSPYDNWSGGQAANIDTNGDGVFNGVAWALDALNPNVNAIGLLPTLDNTSDPTYVIFKFNRGDLANNDANTAISVEYGNDLVGWTPAVDDNDNVDIIVNPGSPTDEVLVKLKRSTLAAGGKIFARLKVVVTP